MFFPHICLCAACVPGACGGQKTILDTVVTDDCDDCEQPCRYWKTSLGLLKKQPVFLIIESSLYTIWLFHIGRKLVQ